mgnify:CR=1 FL=1
MQRLYIRAAAALFLLALGAGSVVARDGFERMRFYDWRIMLKDAHLANERDDKAKAFALYQRAACAGDTLNQRTAPPRASITENTSPPTSADSPRRGTWPILCAT